MKIDKQGHFKEGKTKYIIICMKLYHSYDQSVHKMLHSHALNNIFDQMFGKYTPYNLNSS